MQLLIQAVWVEPGNLGSSLLTSSQGPAWWHTPVIPAFVGQEDLEFKTTMGYIEQLCVKQTNRFPGVSQTA